MTHGAAEKAARRIVKRTPKKITTERLVKLALNFYNMRIHYLGWRTAEREKEKS